MSTTSWLTVALVASILLAVNCDNTEQKSDGQPNKRPFFVMSRYGRSQFHGSKGLRELSVVPRNDRFFLGSRYGKRSQELYPEMLEQDASYEQNGQQHVSCTYTGVTNLYRCSNGPDNNSVERLTTDDTQK